MPRASRVVTTLQLHVTSNNARAIRFYERHGFVKNGEQFPYRNDPTLLEHVMTRDVTKP